MKRTGFWLFVTVLTFALGVASVFVWINYHRPPAQTVQLDSTVESKTEIEVKPPPTAKSELVKNRWLWKASKIMGKIVGYQFVSKQLSPGMYPFVPVRIKVSDSNAISTKPVRKKAQLERIDGYEKFNTVEKMFDEIQAAIDRGNEVVTVTYNKELGFPEKISMSPLRACEDCSFNIEFTDFIFYST